MNNRLKVACFGEVLWDHFPTYSKIGGAPLNVALRLKSLGAEVTLISAIGNDQYGNQIQELLENSNIDTTELIKVSFKTGAVNVSLNEKGDASYDIVHPSAWDKIDYNDKRIKDTYVLDLYSDKSIDNFIKKIKEIKSVTYFDSGTKFVDFDRSIFYNTKQRCDIAKNVYQKITTNNSSIYFGGVFPWGHQAIFEYPAYHDWMGYRWNLNRF